MRIAYLTTYFPPDSFSGIGCYIEHLASSYAKMGHEVEVLVAGNKNTYEDKDRGFGIHWIVSTHDWIPDFLPFIRLLIGSYRCRQKLYELHSKKPFDIVEYPNSGIVGLLTIIIRKSRLKPKFIVRLVSPRFVFKKHSNIYRVTELLEAIQVRLSDAIISVTQSNYDLCQAIYKFSKIKPYRKILLGQTNDSKPHFVKALSNSDNILRVFFLGRMEDRKGFDVLANSWGKVAFSVPHAKLIVAGEDFLLHDGCPYFTWAIKSVPAEARKKIEYLGSVDDELRDLLYQQCDICVIPSRYESFGLISLEAMRYGKPVVSTNVGGIPEVVKQGITGLLVPSGDHEALADALIKLLLNKAMREEMGKMALADVKERFSPERMVRETEEFYHSLLN